MKWLAIAAGFLILSLGLITFWLPIPIGLPLALVGVLLLVRNSSDARHILVRLMRRYPPLKRLLQHRKRRVNLNGRDSEGCAVIRSQRLTNTV